MLFNHPNYEERLVNYCQSLTSKQWRSSATSSNTTWTTGYKGMTLLHLASALGYSKLVCVMLTWRSENPNVILDTEIDALSQDSQGFTPLVSILFVVSQICKIDFEIFFLKDVVMCKRTR